jgi:hypothetical protein
MAAMAETQTPADEPARDVLAAEAFAMPAPDPELHHDGPVVLPEDPTGIAEPHDVLAAEEFAMPAVNPARSLAGLARGSESSRAPLAIGATGALIALWLVARALRRR